jgi:adenylate cyclase class 2
VPPASPHRNIELKARVDSLPRVRQVCLEFAQFSAHERQIDTYFTCQQGRLKLRERGTQTAQLVAYARPDETTPRVSDYWLVPVVEPSLVKAALASALGVKVVVEKDREVFLYRNVRIHLDRVAGLGDFLELEAVLGEHDDELEATHLVAELARRFGVEPSDRIGGSYSDLLLLRIA